MNRLATTAPDFEPTFAALLAQARETAENVGSAVAAIIADVRARGDLALVDYTTKFDHLTLATSQLRIGTDEIDAATQTIPADLAAALDLAADRIEKFHRAQLPTDMRIDDAEGLTLGLRWNALDAVGLYVPGGKAAYPSSVLMNAIPARVAGVSRVAMCVPSPGGALNPLVLAAARRAGVSEIYRVGGAQAIAALAWGTATSRRSTASSAPATPTSPKPSARCSVASASTRSPAPPKSWSSPTPPTIRAAWRSTCWRRPSTTKPRRRS